MEHMNKVLVLTAVLAIFTGARAQAQDAAPVEAPSAGVPIQRTQRELVLPEGYVRGDLALAFGDTFDLSPESGFFAHDFGGGLSIVENLEFGVSLNREWFWPRVGGGLIPIYWDGDRAHFWRIPIYARYQFVTSEHVAIAADVEMNLATHGYSNSRRHAFRASLPVRLRFGSFMFDTGFTFEAETKGPANRGQANMYFPAVFTLNATEALFFRLATGVGIWDMRSEGVHMPLFFGGGYTLTVADTVADINLDFGFPYLAHNDAFRGPGGDSSSPDIWMVKISFAAYLDLL